MFLLFTGPFRGLFIDSRFFCQRTVDNTSIAKALDSGRLHKSRVFTLQMSRWVRLVVQLLIEECPVGTGVMNPRFSSPDIANGFRRDAVLGREQRSGFCCFVLPLLEDADSLVWGQPRSINDYISKVGVRAKGNRRKHDVSTA